MTEKKKGLEKKAPQSAESETTTRGEQDVLDAVMENTKTCLAYLDTRFNFVRVNSAYAAGSGHNKDKLIGHNHFELFPNAENEAIFKRVRDTGEPVEFRARPFHFADQPLRGVTYWDWTLAPVKVAGGQVDGLVLSLLDVTERVVSAQKSERLIEELGIERTLLEAVLQQMPCGVLIAEAPSGKVFLANEEAAHIWGKPPVSASNKEQYREWQGFHPRVMRAYLPEEWPLARAIGRGEVVVNEEIDILREDGCCGTASVSAAPVHDPDGHIVAGVAVFVDETERRRVGDELRWLSRAVEQSPSTVVITDTKGNIEYVNPKFTQLTGYRPEEVIGKNPRILKSGQMAPEEYRRLWLTITAGEEWRGEFHNKKKNGELYWEWTSISPIRNDAGEITHYLAVKEDITARKKAEQFREEYISLISHDLRNPLTSINGMAQWLQHRLAATDLQREAEGAQTILKNSKRMAAMITEMVESAMLEAGQFELRKELVDLSALLQEIAKNVGTLEDRARIKLEVATGLPPILADRERIERAIVNLLTNALKYSPANTLVIARTEAYGREALLSVLDQGIGVRREDIPHLFERYYRAKGSEKAEGLGLGLYITRLIAEAHGGRIWVESDLGRGSAFHLALPLT